MNCCYSPYSSDVEEFSCYWWLILTKLGPIFVFSGILWSSIMKGRARAPSSPESEESWTVDCPCGVNFDDGEEMVDCDECGVWVHTSCCRILKGHTSYVCDKCKLKKKKKESEETEVAQLLIELPSKTPPIEEKAMDKPQIYPQRTTLSIEERAHIQGIPGGDPQFFVGVSPVFSQQLWKHTGYVPKVLGFNYKELPDSPEDKGTSGVLFGESMKEPLGNITRESSRKENKVEEEKDVQQTRMDHNQLYKEKYPRRELRKDTKHRYQTQEDKTHHYSKRRRDDTGKKESASKKRTRSTTDSHQRYQETAKRSAEEVVVSVRSSRTAAKNPKAMRKIAVEDFTEAGDEDLKSANDCSNMEIRWSRGPERLGHTREGGCVAFNTTARQDISKTACGGNHHDYGYFSQSAAGNSAHLEGQHADACLQKETHFDSCKTDVKTTLKENLHNTMEDTKESVQRLRLNIVMNNKQRSEDLKDDVSDTGSGHKKSIQEQEYVDTEEHVLDEDASVAVKQQASDHIENQSRSVTCSEQIQSKAVKSTQERLDDAIRPLDDEGTIQQSRDDALADNRDQEGNIQSATASSPTGSSVGSGFHPQGVAQLSPPTEKSVDVVLTQPVPASRVSQCSSTVSNDKGGDGVANSENQVVQPTIKAHSSSRHKAKLDNALETKKADITATAPGDPTAEGHANELPDSLPRHSSKETTKISEPSATKGLGHGKSSQVPVSAKILLHSKALSASTTTKHGQPSFKSESGSLSMSQEQPNVSQSKQTIKLVSSRMLHKSEKSRMTSGASVLKAATVTQPLHTMGMLDQHVPASDNTPPVLNDEELALLLHQELNSSPRVARVSRVRQSVAGSYHLPTKRPSGLSSPVSSQKEPSIFRRKVKDDFHGDVSHGPDDTPKAEVLGSIKHEGTIVGNRKEKDVSDSCLPTVKPCATPDANRHLSPGSAIGEGESPSDISGATDYNDRERRGSNDILTLPGLIEEILNERGHQASYDSICDEVLPHWPKLRKHNGEPYAYTSHRQAVLDCLRNRSAWSHLIDRGPKTNLGRKRRRPDLVNATPESADQSPLPPEDEGDDHRFGRSSKDVEMDGSESYQPSVTDRDADLTLPEEVPKGKRKARCGRRLALRSKGGGSRSRRSREDRADTTGSEDDHERVFSPLSEGATSTYSEEEIHVHRGIQHVSRPGGSSVDSGDDEMDI